MTGRVRDVTGDEIHYTTTLKRVSIRCAFCSCPVPNFTSELVKVEEDTCVTDSHDRQAMCNMWLYQSVICYLPIPHR